MLNDIQFKIYRLEMNTKRQRVDRFLYMDD